MKTYYHNTTETNKENVTLGYVSEYGSWIDERTALEILNHVESYDFETPVVRVVGPAGFIPECSFKKFTDTLANKIALQIGAYKI